LQYNFYLLSIYRTIVYNYDVAQQIILVTTILIYKMYVKFSVSLLQKTLYLCKGIMQKKSWEESRKSMEVGKRKANSSNNAIICICHVLVSDILIPVMMKSRKFSEQRM